MIEKGLERRPRDILVRKRPDGKRPGYGRWDDPGMSPGTSHDHGRDSSNDPGPAHLSHNAPAPAPAPVDYSSLDNEEQQAVDRGEPTAQMTPTERNEQGHGPGGTNNPDYKQKQYEITGDIDELSDFRGIDTRPKVDIADIHGETDDPSSVSYDPTYNPAYQARQTRQAIAKAESKSGLGTFLKAGATALAWPLASAFLPPKLMTGLTWGKRAHDFSKNKGAAAWLLRKAGGDPTKLTSNLKSKMLADKPKVAEKVWGPQKYLQPKKTVHKDDHGAADAGQMVPESLKSTVSEGTQMFLTDEQREQYRLAQNKMKAALAEGFYIDKDGKHIDLSEEQINALTQWITRIDDLTRQTEQQVMRAADGGRVDKALGGRVRDI